jgi:hypothetical protein
MHGMGMGYNKIARELGVSSKTVRDSGKRRIERRNSHKKHSSAGVKPMDWERIDNETLPVVREAVENLMLQTDARPRRINPNSVCRMLGIPYKRLEKMPLCRNEVLVNGETQEHFWARETIWALDVIKKKGCELNWTAVRRLTNMKKRDFERCIPDLENISTQEIFKEIMEKIVL